MIHISNDMEGILVEAEFVDELGCRHDYIKVHNPVTFKFVTKRGRIIRGGTVDLDSENSALISIKPKDKKLTKAEERKGFGIRVLVVHCLYDDEQENVKNIPFTEELVFAVNS